LTLLLLLLPALPALLHIFSTLTSTCGRFGTGSIVFAGLGGGLETWTGTWTLAVTGE
jgi:hypothetical protein